jgi:hypothetical protein
MRWETFDEPPARPDDDAAYLHGANSRAHRRTVVSHRPVQAEARSEAALGLLERPEWHAWAACRGMSNFFDLTFEEQDDRCAVCPVTEECRQAGLKEPFGMWAGEVKPGLEPVADELADRILDLVAVRPYVLTVPEIIDAVRAPLIRALEGGKRPAPRGASVRRVRAKVRELVAEGRLAQYETMRSAPTGGQGLAIVYGPAERPAVLV